MSDDVTKRDLKTDVEELKTQTNATPATAFRTEDGRYLDKNGNTITDFRNVVFFVPPEVWNQWDTTKIDFGINVTEE